MRTLFAAAALVVGSLSLAACSGTQEAAPEAEANPTGLTVANARLLLPPAAGDPAAVYFDLKNDGTRAVAVRRADVANAKSATLHDMMEYNREMTMADMGPMTIKPGETIRFEPGGKHVMAFEPSPELKPGGKTELTLTIAGGDKVSVELPVEAADAER
ncbi:MAG: copper chaperone PCu(A)C [Qipengyuania sp.]|nr:copper chaperone PCu(A)C [Qipengyuania sp.]